MRLILLLSAVALMIVQLPGCAATPVQPPVVGPALLFFYTEG